YAVWFFELLRLDDLRRQDITDTILASVVPDASFNLIKFCREHCAAEPLVVGEPGCHLGLAIDTDRPDEVGADRLVNAIAAGALYDKPAIVIDFGTATTFDVVDAAGAYIGGIIAPGPNLSVQALHLAAAKLPPVSIKPTAKTIGRNTVDAMQSGVFWGYVGLIEGLLARVSAELAQKPVVITTGGLGRLFHEQLPGIDHYDPDLTLNGLRLIHHRNQGH
ncbi:MAG: type III pantothenate kinase, partial [Pseudomonadota bacterium]